MHELKLYSPVGLNSLLEGSYESMMFADLVLTCGNGVFRPVAHKCILSSVSPFLKMLLDSNPDSNELIVPDVSPETMVWILQLIYTGETVVKSQSEICKIVEGVELLQIQIDGIQIMPENKLVRESSCSISSGDTDSIADLVGTLVAEEKVDLEKPGESSFHPLEDDTFMDVVDKTGDFEDFLKDNSNHKHYESHHGYEINQKGDGGMLVMKEKEVQDGRSDICKKFKFSMTDEMIIDGLHRDPQDEMLDSAKSEIMELAKRAIAKDHGYNKYSRPGVVPKSKRYKKVTKLVNLENENVAYTEVNWNDI